MARLRGVDGVVPAVLADGERRGPGGGAERRIDMDAVEFIRERNRMCDCSPDCAACPAGRTPCGLHGGPSVESVEKLVQIVEEWAKAHPQKTRQSEFLRQWPEARVDKDGILSICPADIAKSLRDEYGGCDNPMENCRKCRREFWGQEVE